MAGFTIEIKGLDKLQALFKQLPKVVRAEINNEFKAVGDEWTGAARADAPANVGRLRSAISKKPEELALEIVAQTDYAAYQEFGTKKNFKAPAELGSYPSSFKGPGDGGDPILALTAWVKRKGLSTSTVKVKNKDKAAKSIAFLIYRKIKRDGIKAHSFLFSTSSNPGSGDRLKYFTNKIKTNVAAALQRALNA